MDELFIVKLPNSGGNPVKGGVQILLVVLASSNMSNVPGQSWRLPFPQQNGPPPRFHAVKLASGIGGNGNGGNIPLLKLNGSAPL